MIKLIQSFKSSRDKTLATDSLLGKLELPKLKAEDKLILGISGGPDSVFLLHQLLLLKPRPEIILSHVNYHLRGWASNTDQSFVEQLAKDNHLKIEIFSATPAQLKGNLEENCRHIRYQFFEDMREKHQARYILTAHNQDDQIETFLLNIIRGASLSGFSGISVHDTKRYLLRPILNISKAEILNYLKSHKITYRQDQSNFDLKFRRNYLRHKIIPLMKKMNPNLGATLSESIRNLQDNQLLIQDQIDQWLSSNLRPGSAPQSLHADETIQFELNQFLSCSPAFQKKLLAGAHRRLHHRSFTSHQLKEILQTLQKNRAGLRKEFGPKAVLRIVKDPKTQKRLVVIEPKLH
jgi:tRNA(Ile)-lysidine synthetase-like protein